MLKDKHAHDRDDDTALDETETPTTASDEFPLPPIPSREVQGLDVGHWMAVYCAGSRAHEVVLKSLGITGFQFGVTGRRHVDDRVADKRRRRYGATMMDPANPEAGSHSLVGGKDVFLTRIDEAMLKNVVVPRGLSISGGVIVFRVKPLVTVEQVDKLVSAALVGRSLNRYLGSPDGQRRMRQAELDPNHRLVTCYGDIGPNLRFSIATEIYLVRPKREMQKLLDVIARALAHVLVL